jgi:hypothetical protein
MKKNPHLGRALCFADMAAGGVLKRLALPTSGQIKPASYSIPENRAALQTFVYTVEELPLLVTTLLTVATTLQHFNMPIWRKM